MESAFFGDEFDGEIAAFQQAESLLQFHVQNITSGRKIGMRLKDPGQRGARNPDGVAEKFNAQFRIADVRTDQCQNLADELFRGLDRVVLACHVSENFHDDGAFPADLQRGGVAHDGFQFIEQRFRIDIDNLMARVLIGKHEGVRQRTVEAEPPRGALFRQTGQKPLLA